MRYANLGVPIISLQNMRNQKNKLQHTVIVIANITMFFTGSEI